MSNKKNNLKYAKKLKDEFSAFEQVFNSHIEKVKKEHNKVLLQKMSELISNISSNENLDEIYLREKYLNLKEINEKKEKKVKKEETIEEDLLDQVLIDDIEYFYENKENGKIFDNTSSIVGKFVNGEFTFT
jgi:hypothetical protein